MAPVAPAIIEFARARRSPTENLAVLGTSIISDFQRVTPIAAIETVEVRVGPFSSCDAKLARDEGEGDLSLAFWRRVHREFFSRKRRAIGREPGEAMPVVFERFRVLAVA